MSTTTSRWSGRAEGRTAAAEVRRAENSLLSCDDGTGRVRRSSSMTTTAEHGKVIEWREDKQAGRNSRRREACWHLLGGGGGRARGATKTWWLVGGEGEKRRDRQE